MNLKNKIEEYIPYDEQEEKDKGLMLEYFDKFDDVLTRENRFGHFTSSAWLLNETHDKVLFIYHNQYDSWAWTGGHNDGEQDALSVALREAREETGLEEIKPISKEIYSIEILTVDGHIKKGKYVSSHVHLNVTYILEASEDEALYIKPDENKDIKWINIEDATKITSELKMIPIYQKLIDKIKNI